MACPSGRIVIVDSDGRFVICDCSINNVEYIIINLYAPKETNARIMFFERIYLFLDCRRKLGMLGDFHDVCDARNCSSRIQHSDSNTRILNKMTTEFTLEDVANNQKSYENYGSRFFCPRVTLTLTEYLCQLNFYLNLMIIMCCQFSFLITHLCLLLWEGKRKKI